MANYRVVAVLLFAGLGPVAAESVPAPTVEDIMSCAAANAPDRSFVLKAAFRTENEQAQRNDLATRLYGLYGETALQLNLRIAEPADLAGTAFYIKEQSGQDDMRVYLPGLNRVRRVTGSMAARELWGTSFSYLDIKQMFGAFVGGEVRALPPTEFLGRPAHALEIHPGEAESAPFTRLEVLLDAETCVPLTADYEDADGQAIKRLRADPGSITSLGDHRLATDFTMSDLLSGKTTRVQLSDIRYDKSIPRSAFSSNGFHRVR